MNSRQRERLSLGKILQTGDGGGNYFIQEYGSHYRMQWKSILHKTWHIWGNKPKVGKGRNQVGLRRNKQGKIGLGLKGASCMLTEGWSLRLHGHATCLTPTVSLDFL